jgi:succinoglycan biosynthesis transport protein ExoP
VTPETPQPPAGAQRATAREFLAVIFRRRWIILGLFAATLGTVLFMSFSTPLSYVSLGQVLVRRGEQKSVMQPYFQVTNDWEIDLGSEVETVRSWAVLRLAQQILDRERGDQPELKVSQSGVHVEVTGKTNVLAIGYVDRDPRVAERACDALLRAYVEYRQRAILAYPKSFFDDEIAKAGTELEQWLQQRREFSRQTGIVDLPTQRTNLILLRSGLEQRRADALSLLEESKAQYRLMGQLRQNPDVDMPSLLQSTLDGTLDQAKRSVMEQQGRLTRLRERYRDDSPEVVYAQNTLDSLRAMLQREADARYAISRSRVEVAQAKLSVIDREIADASTDLARMGDLEARSSDIDHKIATWKKRHEDLAQSSSQALVNENTSPTISVFLLDPAGPARPENTRDYVRLGLAPAFSLVVGVGLAFFVDGLDLTVHTSGHAEEETRLPVLAAVPERRRREERPAGNDPDKDAA